MAEMHLTFVLCFKPNLLLLKAYRESNLTNCWPERQPLQSRGSSAQQRSKPEVAS